MKNIILLIILSLVNFLVYAQPTEQAVTVTVPTVAAPPPEKPSFVPVNWVSMDTNDTVSIENGTGLDVVVAISVDNRGPDSAGININSCGNITHINPGGTAVCYSKGNNNPSFSSDSISNSATGSYQIKPQ